MRLEDKLGQLLVRMAKKEERPVGSMARILETIGKRKTAHGQGQMGKKSKRNPSCNSAASNAGLGLQNAQ